MKRSRTATAITRAGIRWHLAIACVVCACRTSGPPPPPTDAEKDDPLWHGGSRPYVPQVRNADRIFDALPPYAPIAIADAFVMCRATVTPDPDTTDYASRPDLKMRLQIDGQPHPLAKQRDDSWVSTVSFVDVDLALGDRVEISVWDDDFWSHDDAVGTIHTTFDGSFPLTLRNQAFSVECRAMRPHERAARVRSAAREADPVQDALERVPLPSFFASSLTLPQQPLAAARDALSTAASYVGWNHPDVAVRVARQQRIERDWDSKVRAARDAVVDVVPKRGVPAPVADAGVTASGALECDANAVQRVVAQHPDTFFGYRVDCLLRVEVAPDAGRILTTYPESGVSARVIARDGTTFEATAAFAELNGQPVSHELLNVRSGDHLSVTFGVADARDALPEVAAVRVSSSAPALVRVR